MMFGNALADVARGVIWPSDARRRGADRRCALAGDIPQGGQRDARRPIIASAAKN